MLHSTWAETPPNCPTSVPALSRTNDPHLGLPTLPPCFVAGTVLRTLRLLDATMLRSGLLGSESDEEAQALSGVEARLNAALGTHRRAVDTADRAADEVVRRMFADIPSSDELDDHTRAQLMADVAGAAVGARG